MNDDDENPEDFAISRRLPKLSAKAVEQRRRETPAISLWPLALEFPEEGNIPSEIQPSRPRLHGRWEFVVSISNVPLGLGDTFDTRVSDDNQRVSRVTTSYRVLGRTKGTHYDQLVVEQILNRPKLRMRYHADHELLVAEIGDSRWVLGIESNANRYTATPVDGWKSERHGYPLRAITDALIDHHLRRDLTLPPFGIAWRRKSLWHPNPPFYAWTLSQGGGAVYGSGVVGAGSSEAALELATREAFGETDPGRPARETSTRRVWLSPSGTTLLEVRQEWSDNREQQK